MVLARTDIANAMHNYLDLTKPRSAEVVDSLLEITKQTLECGGDSLVSRFGKSCVSG